MKKVTAIALVPFMLMLAGCPKKGGAGSADAAAEGGAVAAVVDAGPETTNEANVTRYPDDEKAMDRTDTTIKVAKTNALTAVPKGDVVTSLAKGDSVTQITLHGGYYLVIFPDPKDASKKLMGWVPKQSFDDMVYVPTKRVMPTCGAGQILVTNALSPFMPRCAKHCTKSTDCDSKMCDSVVAIDAKSGAPLEGASQYVQACEAAVPGTTPGTGPTAPGTAILPSRPDAGVHR